MRGVFFNVDNSLYSEVKQCFSDSFLHDDRIGTSYFVYQNTNARTFLKQMHFYVNQKQTT